MTSVAKIKNSKAVMADIVAKATSTQPKAVKVKEFGTQSKIAVIDKELSSKMIWAGKRYKSIVATRAKQLVELKDIGETLLEFRNRCPSDKEFGKQIKATPLKVVSQQDRNDLMWLASNWKKLEELRSNGTLQSNSVGVLRKQFRELSKNSEADKTPKGVTAKSTSSKSKTSPTATVAEQRDGMAQTSVKQMSAKDYATIVAKQILESGMDQDEFLKELKAALI